MRYTIYNEELSLSIDSLGAEMVGVSDIKTGALLSWPGDPDIWPRRAPILWPYVGNLKDGQYRLDGRTYSGVLHGFARDYPFALTDQGVDYLVFTQQWNDETLARFPRKYQITIRFTLSGRKVLQKVMIENCDIREMRFGFGYHPGFVFPFDEEHTPSDYVLRFNKPQTLQAVETIQGLLSGNCSPYLDNCDCIPISERMFDDGSICLSGLNADRVALVEKDTGRNISFEIRDFPYLLLWSVPYHDKLHFLCVEPWHTLQDSADTSGEWNEKPCAAQLQPGEIWESNLNITFHR